MEGRKSLTQEAEKPHAGSSKGSFSAALPNRSPKAKHYLRGYGQNPTLNHDGGKRLSLVSPWSTAGDPGRPVILDALPPSDTPADWRTLAALELATGEPLHDATKALCVHFATRTSVERTAAILRLSPAGVRAAIAELAPRKARKPRRKSPPRRPGRLAGIPAADVPLRDRVRVLWFRGWQLSAIADALGVTRATIRELSTPRWTIDGPCRTCVEYAMRVYEPPHLARCPHYSQVFEWTGTKVVLLNMTRKQYLEQLRAKAEITAGSQAFAKAFDHDPDDAEARSSGYAAITATQAQYLQHGHYRAPTSGQGWVHGGSITDAVDATADEWSIGYSQHRDHDW